MAKEYLFLENVVQCRVLPLLNRHIPDKPLNIYAVACSYLHTQADDVARALAVNCAKHVINSKLLFGSQQVPEFGTISATYLYALHEYRAARGEEAARAIKGFIENSAVDMDTDHWGNCHCSSSSYDEHVWLISKTIDGLTWSDGDDLPPEGMIDIPCWLEEYLDAATKLVKETGCVSDLNEHSFLRKVVWGAVSQCSCHKPGDMHNCLTVFHTRLVDTITAAIEKVSVDFYDHSHIL
jgi:hypothetical protein